MKNLLIDKCLKELYGFLSIKNREVKNVLYKKNYR